MINYILIPALLFLFSLSISAQQNLYDITSVTIIELTFYDLDWDQQMDVFKINSEEAEKNCEHDYEDERALAHCVINGIAFDSVGVKYKGNSTYDADNSKNPLNIKLDHIIDQNYMDYETLKLSNIFKDPSMVREVLSYEILREYMNGSESNFAQVYINGNLYGLFTSTEAIKKKFAKEHFNYNSNHALIKGGGSDLMAGFMSSLEFIDNDTTSYMCSYQIKSDYGWTELYNLINTLNNDADNIESVLDIDRTIWMFAYNNALCNFDSYIGAFKQNYYLIYDSNGRMCPVVWDLNMSFGGFTMTDLPGGGGPGGGGPGGDSNIAETDFFLHEDDQDWPLAQLIFKNDRYRKMYIAHTKTIMDEFFINEAYKTKATDYQSFIKPYIDETIDGINYNTIVSNIESTVDKTVGIAELVDDRLSYFNTVSEYNATQPAITLVDVPDKVEAFSTVTISATLENANYAYLGYRHSESDIFTKIEMVNAGDKWQASFIVEDKNTHYYIYAENTEAGIFSPQRAEHEYYKIYGDIEENFSTDIAVNEIMASNSTVASDEYGEFDDWIELYNNTDSDISLAGYYLTDDVDEIMKWVFPDTVIQAKDYLIVWADDDEEQGDMHTNFKLSASGENVYLFSPDLAIANGVDFDSQITDMSYSRIPNGLGDFVIQEPTYLKNNEIDFAGTQDIMNEDVLIYPIPAQDNLNIDWDIPEGQNYTIEIINMWGQHIIIKSAVGSHTEIPINNLTPGIYVLVLKNNTNVVTQSFIKE